MHSSICKLFPKIANVVVTYIFEGSPGPSCSKLTASLVNVSNVNISNTPILLKKIGEAFAMQKLLSFFSRKMSVYFVVSRRPLTCNELISS